uniref:VAT-1 protein n=1 Tax=Tetronarce californica TaxID=7787 RepID=Q7LZS5_TETCF
SFQEAAAISVNYTAAYVPTLKSDEILVRVQACGLNFGTECAGVVEAIGDLVIDRKVGDLIHMAAGGVGIAATQEVRKIAPKGVDIVL